MCWICWLCVLCVWLCVRLCVCVCDEYVVCAVCVCVCVCVWKFRQLISIVRCSVCLLECGGVWVRMCGCVHACVGASIRVDVRVHICVRVCWWAGRWTFCWYLTPMWSICLNRHDQTHVYVCMWVHEHHERMHVFVDMFISAIALVVNMQALVCAIMSLTRGFTAISWILSICCDSVCTRATLCVHARMCMGICVSA
jgi:hypothetical protein